MGARAVIAVAVAAIVGGAPGAADSSWGSRGVVRVPLGRSVKFVKAERVAFSRGTAGAARLAGSVGLEVRRFRAP